MISEFNVDDPLNSPRDPTNTTSKIHCMVNTVFKLHFKKKKKSLTQTSS